MKRSDYGTEAYRQGFIDGIDAKDNYKIQIMGYDLFTIFDVLEKHMTNDKPKVKMTRAEAIASLQKHCPVNDPAAIIDFYIEAGMLEVVKEKSYAGLPIGFKFPFDKRNEWSDCCDALYDQGYQISKP